MPGKRWDAESIAALRRRLGLTQGEMARRIGARQQTISEWETGKYSPRGTSATVLGMLAEAPGALYQAGPAAGPPTRPGGRSRRERRP